MLHVKKNAVILHPFSALKKEGSGSPGDGARGKAGDERSLKA